MTMALTGKSDASPELKAIQEEVLCECHNFPLHEKIVGDEKVGKELQKWLHQNRLAEVTVIGYGGIRTLSRSLGQLNFLRFLSLEDSRRCTVLPPLGKLLSLKGLRIKGMKGVESVGLEFYGEDCSNPFPVLESLHFEDMEEWKDWFPCDIDEEVLKFPRLSVLSIVRCPKLKGNLPNHLPSLKKLYVRDCQSLRITVSRLPSLIELEISGCHDVMQSSGADLGALKSVAIHVFNNVTCSSKVLIQGITELLDLNIVYCDELVSLWAKEEGLLEQLTLLRRLEIRNCPRFSSLVAQNEDQQEQVLSSGCKLEYLALVRCGKLDNLQGLHNLKFLRELSIVACPQLNSFPSGVLPAQLGSLEIIECENLEFLPVGLHKLHHLSVFRISDCPQVVWFPEGGLPADNLTKLEISNCDNLEALPEGMCNLRSLKELTISNCPDIASFPQEDLPTNLVSLVIRDLKRCKPLFEWGLERITSLEHLTIAGGYSKMVTFPAEEEKMTLPSSLVKLTIGNFPKLKNLSSNLFQTLNCLRELCIFDCPKLQPFPEDMVLPSNLQLSIIHATPKQEWPKWLPAKQEWLKMCHIPCVFIDGRFTYCSASLFDQANHS